MAIPAGNDRGEFHRVVLAPKCGGSQKEPQDLRVGLGGPACKEVEDDEDQQTAEQAIEQVERASPKAHSEKEEPSLGSEDGEGPGQ
jgi:hypothetical protein